MKSGQTILVTSGKGGTGKSTVSINLGAMLSRKGYSVVIVDMDAGLRNLDLYLGLEDKIVYDVYDVAKSVCDLELAAVRVLGFDKMHYLASGPLGFVEKVSHSEYTALFRSLLQRYDYVIVDTAAGMSFDFCQSIPAPVYAIIVANPDIATVRGCEGARWILRQKGIKDYFLVINRAYVKLLKSGYAMPLKQVTSRVNAKLIGIIREDINIRISTNMGVPIVVHADSSLTESFKQMADRLVLLTSRN